MTAVLEAREALCAVPFDPSRHNKAIWLREAARLYRISESFAKKIYYREKKRMDADTLDRMRAIREQLAELRESARARRETFNGLATVARGAAAPASKEARRASDAGVDHRASSLHAPEPGRPAAAAASGPGRAGEGG